MIQFRHIARALGAALLLLLVACGGPSVPLTGTVLDAYTGEPVAGATVEVGRAKATSDAAGKYQLAKWSAKGKLRASAAGYEPAEIDLAQQPVDQASGAPTRDISIRPNVLSGAVTERYTGAPVADAVVKVSDTISTTTGTDGRYTLAGVPPSFSVSVTAPDHDEHTAQVDKTTQLDVDLRSNILQGKVTERDTGKPIAGATVRVGDVTATTEADGTYRAPGVPEGATVEITAEGYTAASETAPDAASFDVALQANVLRGAVTDQYTGEPVAEATVKAGDTTAST
ncbi:MAG: carboxypeptidase regulatory-like domain-containing protein, partial [Chloroflexota bacterium]|nr:carboxypeptidase regulatory-like domain-containing protein [Chloroflexota bacterium]